MTHGFLDQDSEHRQNLNKFRKAYFKLAQRVSDSQRSNILTGTTSLESASKILIDSLHGNIDSQFSTAAGVLADASQVAKATGADGAGIASSLISPVVKYGSTMVREFMRNRRNPEIAQFLGALEKSLARSKKKNG